LCGGGIGADDQLLHLGMGDAAIKVAGSTEHPALASRGGDELAAEFRFRSSVRLFCWLAGHFRLTSFMRFWIWYKSETHACYPPGGCFLDQCDSVGLIFEHLCISVILNGLQT
jgi:hypothetical protein